MLRCLRGNADACQNISGIFMVKVDLKKQTKKNNKCMLVRQWSCVRGAEQLSSWFIFRGEGGSYTHTHMRSFGFFAKKRKKKNQC